VSALVTKNKLVTITYLIKDENGETIEQNDVPVSYVHGVGSDILPALETALSGHQENDIVKVSISSEQGFGHYDPELTFSDSLDNVPKEFRYVGAQAKFQDDRGEEKTFTVSKIEANTLTLDANHPFAGKTTNFEVTIHDIRDASDEEIANKAPTQLFDVDIMDPAIGVPH